MALIRHLKLNDNAASTTIVATVGSNATLGGGDNTSAKQTSSGPGGTISYAFDLNGSDDNVNLGADDVYSYATGNAFSISVWLNPDSVTNNYFLGRANSAFRFFRITSSTTITIGDSLTNEVFTVPTMSIGTWYHIFITKTSGNSLRLFLNGVESSTGAIAIGAAIITFDKLGRSASLYFNGRVSEFRHWNNDETANVLTYYNEGVTTVSNIINPTSYNILCTTYDPLSKTILGF